MNRTYSLKQAAVVTGFSEGKFRYNRSKLEAAGAVITSEGWRIPHETLKDLGWLGVKNPKGEISEPSSLERAEMRIAELEAHIVELQRELDRPRFFRKKHK